MALLSDARRFFQDPTQEFLVRCSYIEIYNENITDLLNPKNTNLKIHTNPKVPLPSTHDLPRNIPHLVADKLTLSHFFALPTRSPECRNAVEEQRSIS